MAYAVKHAKFPTRAPLFSTSVLIIRLLRRKISHFTSQNPLPSGKKNSNKTFPRRKEVPVRRTPFRFAPLRPLPLPVCGGAHASGPIFLPPWPSLLNTVAYSKLDVAICDFKFTLLLMSFFAIMKNILIVYQLIEDRVCNRMITNNRYSVFGWREPPPERRTYHTPYFIICRFGRQFA